MEHEFNVIPDCLVSIGTCFILSIVFVASLYVWNSQHDRNHSSTIKRRFLSVFIMMLISPAFLYFALNERSLQKRTIWQILGIRKEGLLQAFVIPLFLTMILFLGPISMQLLNGLVKVYTEPMYWINNMKNLIWLRNHVVAPLSEEFTFRSCMLPILLQCFSPITAVFICPLFFGAGFHFTYTTIFGTYSAYIFLRTGHLASTFIAHAFCNHMGFPDVQELASYKGKQRTLIVSLFVAGFVLWCCLLNPLTEPKWYYNDVDL